MFPHRPSLDGEGDVASTPGRLDFAGSPYLDSEDKIPGLVILRLLDLVPSLNGEGYALLTPH